MLDADRQSHHVFGDAGLLHFLGAELAVGGGRRVAGEALGVADVHQARDQLQRILEAPAAGHAAFDAEGEDARGTAAHVFPDQGVVGMVGQAGVVDPLHLGMALEEVRHRQGVVADAVHAQRQGFDALQDQEGIEGRDRRAGVAQRHHAGTADVGRGAERFGIDHAVVGHVRRVEALEALLVGSPGEFAGIDDDAADAVAMAAEILGQRMHHDVGAVLEGAAQVRRRHRVVHDQRHPGVMGDLRQGGEIDDVAQRVADGLAEQGLGAAVDQRLETFRLAVIGEAHLDAVLRQRVGEQVVGAAVECADRDDVVAGFGDGLDRVGDRRHAGSHAQRADAAFQLRHALFQHVGGRVHDARVDVAGDLEVEQVGAVLGVVEGVGGRLVDRHRDRLGGGIGAVAAMHGDGFDFHVPAFSGCRKSKYRVMRHSSEMPFSALHITISAPPCGLHSASRRRRLLRREGVPPAPAVGHTRRGASLPFRRWLLHPTRSHPKQQGDFNAAHSAFSRPDCCRRARRLRRRLRL